MAALTYTATDRPEPPRLVHISDTFARAQYVHNGATSLSGSDLIFMTKIPTGVWILDGYITGTTGSTANIFKVGVSGGGGTETTLGGALTLGATAAMKRFDGATLPFKVSVSDDAANRFVWVYLTHTSGTSTNTANISLVVNYAPIGAA